MKSTRTLLATLSLCALPLAARAEPPSVSAPVAPSPPPAPYSVPWQLRPAAIITGVRSDTSIAAYEDASKKSTHAVASLLTVIYKVTPEFAPFLRLAAVATPKGGGMANPAFGGTYLYKLNSALRLAGFLGVALPAGEGGGNDVAPGVGNAVRTGVLARSAMDNALFAINDTTLFPGVDLAYVDHGLTVQVEATVLFLMRSRGDEVQKDRSKVNFTSGLHVGYFVLPWLSAGAELRYQRWLSTPVAVGADKTGALRDNLSFAVGPRFHFKLGESTWLRPGASYARGLDQPMAGAKYSIAQLDLLLIL